MSLSAYAINTGTNMSESECRWCGERQSGAGRHPAICPRITAVSFHDDGTLSQVSVAPANEAKP